jgi:D-alanyl-D-alanine carboxypeptidase (penicillin-binding protein 5/6)
MGRRILGVVLLLLALALLIATPVFAFTPFGTHSLSRLGLIAPSPTPIPRPTPPPPPKLVITVTKKPPVVDAKAVYMVDMANGDVLDDTNGETPMPMASTTKIMTALIAIQTADLNMPITVKQDAYNRVHLDGGSSAQLVVGDTLPLKDLLYGMLLPSGDDAATAIADALGNGSSANFVQRMNLFAYRLRLFQTHYDNPDGLSLTPQEDAQHYTTAANLTRLARYAMSIPLFAQIVHTQTYHVPASAQHHAYTWTNTDTLLGTYKGMIGIKTGFTFAAGYCLVFAATRANYHLIGVVLNSPSDEQRIKDVTTLLNWGFSLPLLPPDP